jgi:TonB family protein
VISADAFAGGVQGIVFLDVVIDRSGSVRDARIIGSIPQFDAAAQTAVRGWRYSPLTADVGSDIPDAAVKLVSVRFAPGPAPTPLDYVDVVRFYAVTGRGDAQAMLQRAIDSVAEPPPANSGGTVTPTKIKDVSAIYPPVARNAAVQGVVGLELTINEQGNVTNARVTRGVHPLLDASAVIAARQWKYAPTVVEGKPVPVTTNVTVTFSLGR